MTNSDETTNLLDNEDSTDQEEVTDSVTAHNFQEPPIVTRDSAQAQSDRIRSKYLAQILPNTSIP